MLVQALTNNRYRFLDFPDRPYNSHDFFKVYNLLNKNGSHLDCACFSPDTKKYTVYIALRRGAQCMWKAHWRILGFLRANPQTIYWYPAR
jgi:hypothetical protein